MRTIIIAILLLCAIIPCSPLHARNCIPQLEVVGGTTVDFGDVPPGICRRRLVIANAGCDTLRILDIKNSDGGMNGWPVSRTLLGPGDTASIDIQWQLPPSAGPWIKGGYITTNDPICPTTLIRVEATVVGGPGIRATGTNTDHSPSLRRGYPRIEAVGGTTLNFGDVREGISCYMMGITNTGTDTLRIHDIRHNDGGMNGWPISQRIIPPGDTAWMDIQWQFCPVCTPRSANRVGFILSNDPATPRLEIKVHADIVVDSTLPGFLAACRPAVPRPPKISVVGGTTIDFGRIPPGTCRHLLGITNIGGDTLRILNIRSSDGGMNGWPIDHTLIPPGDTAHIDIAWDLGSRPPGPKYEAGWISSNDPADSIIYIPVRAVVVR